MIGEHERHHRLDDRDRARQHARVVPPARLDRGVVARLVDGLLLAQDGGRRLERDANGRCPRRSRCRPARRPSGCCACARARRRRRTGRCAGCRSGACRRSRCRSRTPSPPAATASPWRGRPPACRTPARPSPAGTPRATASTTPPSESPAFRASSMRAIMRSAIAASGQRTMLASTASRVTVAGSTVDLEVLHARDPRDDVDGAAGDVASTLRATHAGRDAAHGLARAGAAAALPGADAVLRLVGVVGV